MTALRENVVAVTRCTALVILIQRQGDHWAVAKKNGFPGRFPAADLTPTGIEIQLVPGCPGEWLAMRGRDYHRVITTGGGVDRAFQAAWKSGVIGDLLGAVDHG